MLVWPAGVMQVLGVWLGVVCPLCPSDISPASGGNPAALSMPFRAACPRCFGHPPAFASLRFPLRFAKGG